MFVVIIFIFIGILVGYGVRRHNTAWLSRAITLLVWLLLFLMGIEVGGNERIMLSLPTLGLEALLLAALATLGSCVGAWLLGKYIYGKRGGER